MFYSRPLYLTPPILLHFVIPEGEDGDRICIGMCMALEGKALPTHPPPSGSFFSSLSSSLCLILSALLSLIPEGGDGDRRQGMSMAL